jgi:MFS family permease
MDHASDRSRSASRAGLIRIRRESSSKQAHTRAMKTPRAAAIAGMLFSVLLLTTWWLLHVSMPSDPLEPGAWLRTNSQIVALALNLVPFAGIAFLWFIGVLRDRLGDLEDRFFATVILGSALLFLAMLFSAAAVTGALVLGFAAEPNEFTNSPAFHIARATVYSLMNVYAVKAAAVFMISTSTVVIYTGFMPAWIAWLGYTLALPILVGGSYIQWGFVVLPVWVLLISLHILVENFREERGLQQNPVPESPTRLE